MASLRTIFVCCDYREHFWELPILTLSGHRRALIAWCVRPEPVDGGIPDEIAEVLAQALVSNVLVSFPVRQRKGNISFENTTRGDDLRAAFDAEYFVWSRRGQVFLLSPLNETPPPLSVEVLDAATSADGVSRLISMGLNGVVLPGVDGDVAGLYTFAPGLLEMILLDVKAMCEEIGVEYRDVSEQELIASLAACH